MKFNQSQQSPYLVLGPLSSRVGVEAAEGFPVDRQDSSVWKTLRNNLPCPANSLVVDGVVRAAT